jgi:hypothetical protein
MSLNTFKVRNVDRNGKFIKGHTFVSGTVLSHTTTTFTIEVTHHDDWHGTSYDKVYTLPKKRIMAVAGSNPFTTNNPDHPSWD